MNIQNGQTVSVHYVGRLNDGTEFDSSVQRGEPLKFEFGSGQILPAFEEALKQMEIGEKKSFSLTPDQAYGPVYDQAIQTIPKKQFGENVNLSPGEMVHGKGQDGQEVQAIIQSVTDENVILDFNHPLAGKDINFDIELLSVD
tara:strand:- start:1578 stop:2006 length:429 start_codon:yes stop_codon:yes gene_type:complete